MTVGSGSAESGVHRADLQEGQTGLLQHRLRPLSTGRVFFFSSVREASALLSRPFSGLHNTHPGSLG